MTNNSIRYINEKIIEPQNATYIAEAITCGFHDTRCICRRLDKYNGHYSPVINIWLYVIIVQAMHSVELSIPQHCSRICGYCQWLTETTTTTTTTTSILMPLSLQARVDSFGINLEKPSFAISCILLLQFQLQHIIFHASFPQLPLNNIMTLWITISGDGPQSTISSISYILRYP